MFCLENLNCMNTKVDKGHCFTDIGTRLYNAFGSLVSFFMQNIHRIVIVDNNETKYWDQARKMEIFWDIEWEKAKNEHQACLNNYLFRFMDVNFSCSQKIQVAYTNTKKDTGSCNCKKFSYYAYHSFKVKYVQFFIETWES